MAIWQLDLEIVPQGRVRSLLEKSVHPGINRDAADVDWWEGAELPPHFEERLANLLPRGKSWDSDWRLYGQEEGNRVDVIYDAGRLVEIRARLDVRDVDFDLLERLADVLTDADCVFIDETGHVIAPTADNLCVEIEASPAANFITDPKKFLERRNRRNHE